MLRVVGACGCICGFIGMYGHTDRGGRDTRKFKVEIFACVERTRLAASLYVLRHKCGPTHPVNVPSLLLILSVEFYHEAFWMGGWRISSRQPHTGWTDPALQYEANVG